VTSNGKEGQSRWKWARRLAVAISVVVVSSAAGGAIYLLAWYVPDVLARRPRTNASVESAYISAGAALLGVIATAAVAIVAFWYARSTNQATIRDQGEQLDKTLAAQREQLDDTLAAQREQLDKTLAAQRDQLDSTLTRTLNERFATAAGQLGGDKPPAVRLAGVYAMAGLADDWEKNRQTCVDVLCGYLRLPYEPDPGNDADPAERAAYRASREVRHTVIRVITAHLRADAPVSWQRLNLDFTGVTFDGGDFSGAVFSGGTVSFTGAEFSGGTVYFGSAEFSGGTVDFDRTKFSGGGKVYFTGAEFSGGTVYFRGAEFSGGTVGFHGARFTSGTVDFNAAKFSDGTVYVSSAEFSGGTVYFGSAEFSGGTVDFTDARFTSGTVSFSYAVFSGSEVDLTAARFSGGEVDLSRASYWSNPPKFPWAHTPPPGVKLPPKRDQPQV
jgi:uncharacterized protein YjbI with pentapeptide repeats